MRRTYNDNNCTVRVTMTTKDGKRRQYRQRTSWRDEIGSFGEVVWNRQTADRDELRRLSCLQVRALSLAVLMKFTIRKII